MATSTAGAVCCSSLTSARKSPSALAYFLQGWIPRSSASCLGHRHGTVACPAGLSGRRYPHRWTEGLDTDMFVFVGVALIDVGGIFRWGAAVLQDVFGEYVWMSGRSFSMKELRDWSGRDGNASIVRRVRPAFPRDSRARYLYWKPLPRNLYSNR